MRPPAPGPPARQVGGGDRRRLGVAEGPVGGEAQSFAVHRALVQRERHRRDFVERDDVAVFFGDRRDHLIGAAVRQALGGGAYAEGRVGAVVGFFAHDRLRREGPFQAVFEARFFGPRAVGVDPKDRAPAGALGDEAVVVGRFGSESAKQYRFGREDLLDHLRGQLRTRRRRLRARAASARAQPAAVFDVVAGVGPKLRVDRRFHARAFRVGGDRELPADRRRDFRRRAGVDVERRRAVGADEATEIRDVNVGAGDPAGFAGGEAGEKAAGFGEVLLVGDQLAAAGFVGEDPLGPARRFVAAIQSDHVEVPGPVERDVLRGIRRELRALGQGFPRRHQLADLVADRFVAIEPDVEIAFAVHLHRQHGLFFGGLEFSREGAGDGQLLDPADVADVDQPAGAGGDPVARSRSSEGGKLTFARPGHPGAAEVPGFDLGPGAEVALGFGAAGLGRLGLVHFPADHQLEFAGRAEFLHPDAEPFAAVFPRVTFVDVDVAAPVDRHPALGMRNLSGPASPRLPRLADVAVARYTDLEAAAGLEGRHPGARAPTAQRRAAGFQRRDVFVRILPDEFDLVGARTADVTGAPRDDNGARKRFEAGQVLQGLFDAVDRARGTRVGGRPVEADRDGRLERFVQARPIPIGIGEPVGAGGGGHRQALLLVLCRLVVGSRGDHAPAPSLDELSPGGELDDSGIVQISNKDVSRRGVRCDSTRKLKLTRSLAGLVVFGH